MSDFLRERKIAHLPGTKLSPEVVLARTQEKLPRIKAVLVVIQWDDETMSVDWSAIPLSGLCMASRMLDRAVDEALSGSVG